MKMCISMLLVIVKIVKKIKMLKQGGSKVKMLGLGGPLIMLQKLCQLRTAHMPWQSNALGILHHSLAVVMHEL